MRDINKPIWIGSEDIAPREPTYLLNGIPDDNICLLVGDGGVGKGMLTCHLTAAITTGSATIFDDKPIQRGPERVLLLNAEDSYSRYTTHRLTKAGANHHLITTFDSTVGIPSTSEIVEGIQRFRPKLTIIDPLQAFIPQGAAMERRNVMRKIMAPLQACAAECKCAVLVVMHTNKRVGAFGRNRVSDSSDMWDIARSVFIMGDTYDGCGTRYISHEKSSYGERLQTQLVRIDDKGLYKVGDTEKRDRDFIQDRDRQAGGRPTLQRDQAEQFIINTITSHGGEIDGRQLSMLAEQNDITERTFRRARASLKELDVISISHSGRGSTHTTTYRLNDI